MPFINKKEGTKMKYTIGRCPYCRGMEIAVDTGPAPPEFVWDYHCREPVCRHLVFVFVCRRVDVTDRGWVRTDLERSVRWFYDLYEGLREIPLDGPWEPLMDYVDHWIRGLLSPSDEPSIEEYEYAAEGGTDLTGGRAGVEVHDAVWVSDTLDGFAVFAANPDELAAAVCDLAGLDPA